MIKAVYYHHAIVTSVDVDCNTFNVIERMPGGVDWEVYTMDKDKTIWKINNPNRVFSPNETIARAKSRVYEEGYDVENDNCERFAEWCASGMPRSYQIENLSFFKRLLLPVVKGKGERKL